MLSGSSRLVGIIGNPVSQSLSPRMQNAAFSACGLDWAYVPLPVEAERLADAARGLVALGFAGANVTIPYKTAVLACCDTVDEVARKASSVNTIVVREGRLEGSSTDGLAVTGAVATAGAHALVLGAGGSARAVACAILDGGAASVTVAARRPEAAAELATQLRSAFPGSHVGVAGAWPPDASGATLLVNTTSLREELPVEPRPSQQVVDLAYRADGQPTSLVAAARSAGCPIVVDGLEVLVRQGAASFERWTGTPAPIDVMRAAVRPG